MLKPLVMSAAFKIFTQIYRLIVHFKVANLAQNSLRLKFYRKFIRSNLKPLSVKFTTKI